MPDVNPWARLRNAAWLAVVIHVLAGLAMTVVLRQGLDSNTDLPARLDFLVRHKLWWILAWLTWHLAALTILWYSLCFGLAHQNGATPRAALWLAVLIATAGVALDLGAEGVEMGVIPELARAALAEGESGPSTALFRTTHRLATMLTGYAANGLYSITCFLLAWTTRREYRGWEWLGGIAVGAFGLASSATVLVDSVTGMVVTNLLLGPALLYWLTVVGLAAGRRARSAEARG